MGGSGAGKTTLLNVLAKRTDLSRGSSTTGEVLLNGREYDRALLKKMAGYVMQDDLFFGEMTVKETLNFAARLRLPADWSPLQRKERVEKVAQQLGLEHTLDTIVGNAMKKGISGGERKRLSVACELLAFPRLLFLDEPTSGLDSVTAFYFVKILKSLVKSGVTVICTIHQPPAKVFFQFDQVLLLDKGETVYFGSTKDAVDYFADAGYPCPNLTNPADHFLDLITVDRSSDDAVKEFEAVQARVSALKERYRTRAENVVPLNNEEFELVPKANWLLQFWTISKRSFTQMMRGRLVLAAFIGQALVMGILIGLVWRDIQNTWSQVDRKRPLLFFVCINQGIFGMIIMVNLFPSERAIVLRERASGLYRSSAYFVAKSLSEIPMQLIPPFLLGTIVYWLTNLERDAGKYIIFIIFTELGALAAVSFGLLISAVARTATLAAALVPLFVEVFRLFGAFFVSPNLLRDQYPYFWWISALSSNTYTYVAVFQNEFKDMKISCPPGAQPLTAACPYINGDQIITAYNMDYIPIWGCGLVLIAMIIFFRVAAYLAIRYIKF
eukprot:TRINITY_DN330_c0_g1_i1.p1 TRINITY_DN330_c0_g1~~TRINITY_DN330_c0_g1_i1.p1  ORF type:complete len:637 (+),score=136.07 TRINITY_DN330_c0_g1_i1:247-1911(+)